MVVERLARRRPAFTFVEPPRPCLSGGREQTHSPEPAFEGGVYCAVVQFARKICAPEVRGQEHLAQMRKSGVLDRVPRLFGGQKRNLSGEVPTRFCEQAPEVFAVEQGSELFCLPLG